jgi:hypothetical protein
VPCPHKLQAQRLAHGVIQLMEVGCHLRSAIFTQELHVRALSVLERPGAKARLISNTPSTSEGWLERPLSRSEEVPAAIYRVADKMCIRKLRSNIVHKAHLAPILLARLSLRLNRTLLRVCRP